MSEKEMLDILIAKTYEKEYTKLNARKDYVEEHFPEASDTAKFCAIFGISMPDIKN
jgi:hypothetical protein